jgi:hypothetical protein
MLTLMVPHWLRYAAAGPRPQASLGGAREADGKLGKLIGLAIDGDRAAMLLRHDVVADREPEPGAFAGRLGGEERLE